MYSLRSIAAAVFAVSTMYTTPAVSQSTTQFCADRTALISQLETRHGETRRSAGLQEDSRVIETYANVETGTWTIIITMPTGVACLVAVGENWREDVAVTLSDEAA
ncbi:MAG: hypothetical protein ACPGFA_05375 [Pikeienuella sp.]